MNPPPRPSQRPALHEFHPTQRTDATIPEQTPGQPNNNSIKPFSTNEGNHSESNESTNVHTQELKPTPTTETEGSSMRETSDPIQPGESPVIMPPVLPPPMNEGSTDYDSTAKSVKTNEDTNFMHPPPSVVRRSAQSGKSKGMLSCCGWMISVPLMGACCCLCCFLPLLLIGILLPPILDPPSATNLSYRLECGQPATNTNALNEGSVSPPDPADCVGKASSFVLEFYVDNTSILAGDVTGDFDLLMYDGVSHLSSSSGGRGTSTVRAQQPDRIRGGFFRMGTGVIHDQRIRPRANTRLGLRFDLDRGEADPFIAALLARRPSSSSPLTPYGPDAGVSGGVSGGGTNSSLPLESPSEPRGVRIALVGEAAVDITFHTLTVPIELSMVIKDEDVLLE